MLIYLAGAIERAPDLGVGWRRAITPFLKEELGHRVFDPCIEENHVLSVHEFAEFRDWKRTDLKRFRQTMRKLIDTDLNQIAREVDYLICLWDEYVLGGGGTHGELTLAYYNRIPVYMVTEMPQTEMSGWIIGCTTEIFADFDALKAYLRKAYGE